MKRIREVKLSKALYLISGHTELWALAWVIQKCRSVSGCISGEDLGPDGLRVWGLLNGRAPGYKVLFTDCSHNPQSASGAGLSGHSGVLMGG